ncbi:hypothetical protein ABPG75_013179 [Micractinium tetrahymenae]
MSPWRAAGLAALLLAAVAAAAAVGEAPPPFATTACPDPLFTGRVPEGCPCSPVSNATAGACAAGFVCAQRWTDQVAAAQKSIRRLLSTDAGVVQQSTALYPGGGGSADPSMGPGSSQGPAFICQACGYGQLCPAGSVLPPVLDPSIQLALDGLACPPGWYCPTPAAAQRCPPGYFCPPSTITPITCNMSLLVAQAPMMPVTFQPATVAQRVFLHGDPLQGNTCPANASNPSKGCPPGFYCPEPSTIYPCPAGYFCPVGSLKPQPCPFLTRCTEGAASADLSFSGFVILAVLLVVLWACYGLLRVGIAYNQRRLVRRQEAQERLWKVLHPLLGRGGSGTARRSFRALRAVRPRLTVEFIGLGMELPDGRSILSGVTGRFAHSRVSAILGPSGAGKTTLLNVLRGSGGIVGRQSGRLLVNGREMRLAALQSITGFVPQEDIVHEDLTVRENLAYSARLRLSAAKPAEEKAALVEDCVDLLQLRHVQHQVVGSVERRGISGGQRKRVNIGTELVAKPSLLLMDEPTSGLDSTAAADILGALTRMARLGCTIVAVVHQPRFSIFRMFDDVLLLGKGGHLAYAGPSRLALRYLQSLGFALPPNENPADFMLDVVCGSVPRQDGSPFQPAELPSLWQSHGRSWVDLHSKLAAKDEEPVTAALLQPTGMDPEQLHLLEEQFDEADSDGDGALDAAGLLRLLERLGLEPSEASVAALMAELAVPRTGLLPKQALLQYIQSGGSAGSGPGSASAAAKRRNETLYRVYSIEQYTLASALAELSAGALTPGMRASGASLRDLAAAHHQQQQAGAADAGACGGGEAGAEGQEQHGSGAVSNSSSVQQLDLLGQLQATDAESTEPAASTLGSRQPSFMQPPQQPQQPQQALLVDVAQPLPEPGGLLAWLGLSSGTPLRATPGTASQFWLLLLRSGIKWTRNWSGKMLEVLLLVLAGVVLGVMHGTGADEWQVRGNAAICFLTLGILSGATSLSLFGSARVVWWREQERGIRSLSYFLAATFTQAVDVVLQPAVFLSVYASMTLPAMPWGQLFGVGVLVCWFCTSLGALVSLLAPPSSSLMATVALLMIMGGMLNGVSPNYREMAPSLRSLTSISYNRWAIEIVTVQSFAHFPEWRWPATKSAMNAAGYCGLYAIDRFPEDAAAFAGVDTQRLLNIQQYCDNSVANGVLVLAALGTILRLLSAAALAYFPRGLRLEPVVNVVARWVAGRRRQRHSVRNAAGQAP